MCVGPKWLYVKYNYPTQMVLNNLGQLGSFIIPTLPGLITILKLA